MVVENNQEKKVSKKIIICVLCISIIFSINIPLISGQDAGAGAGSAAEINTSSINNLLSETGRIIPDVENNALMVMDFPYNITMVEEYLKMADIPAEQILIEARVVEVQLEKQHTYGVNWAMLTRAFQIGKVTPYSAINGVQTRGFWQTIPTRDVQWEPFIGDDQENMSVGIFNNNIDVLMQMLTTQLDTDIISAPKITTKNNRRAKIDVVKTIPYLKTVESETDEETGDVTYTIEYGYTDEGVSMEVIPHVNPDRTISMTIVPEIKEIVRWHGLPTPAGFTREVEWPETDVRVSRTKVSVGEGQTLVIGGLIRDKRTEGVTKVPVMGDIPFLGALFRTKIQTTKKTELLILVSPVIIDGKQMKKMAREEQVIGKWYLDDKNVRQEQIGKLEEEDKNKVNKKLAVLEERLKILAEKRKSLENEIRGE